MELLQEHAGVDPSDAEAVLAKAKSLGIYQELPKKAAGDASAEQVSPDSEVDPLVVVDKLFEKTVEPHLIQPTFVVDYPAPLCPLTKRHPDDPSLALRFEAVVANMELANAYSELNDPLVQQETLSARLAGAEDETMAVMDEDFIMALEHGMPPAGGLGVGIDRLVMLLTNQTSIRDVILFPLQRPLSRGSDENTETDL